MCSLGWSISQAGSRQGQEWIYKLPEKWEMETRCLDQPSCIKSKYYGFDERWKDWRKTERLLL